MNKGRVWTTYLSPSKSKPKITPFEEVRIGIKLQHML